MFYHFSLLREKSFLLCCFMWFQTVICRLVDSSLFLLLQSLPAAQHLSGPSLKPGVTLVVYASHPRLPGCSLAWLCLGFAAGSVLYCGPGKWLQTVVTICKSFCFLPERCYVSFMFQVERLILQPSVRF